MRSALATLLSACALLAQSSAPPSFEVASIKQSPPQPEGQVRMGMSADPGRVGFSYLTLRDLMSRAYEVKMAQITGPAWIDSERYDVNAKIPDGVAREQVPTMLRALLEERFQLKLRRETKEMPVYELILAKGGSKLEKAAEPSGRPRITMQGSGDGVMHATINSATMANFSDMVGRWTDRPVIDQTGLTDRFDINLDLAMEDLARSRSAMVVIQGGPPSGGGGGPAPDSNPAGSLFTSMQKLGLKLEPKRAPLELLIVEKAEKVPLGN
jgi:uncharacterized protein (TIGR03435 family)